MPLADQGQHDDPISFWVPLEFTEPDGLMKAEADWPAAYEVRMVVSSQAKDLDGETIHQAGINWNPFMAKNPLTGKPLAPLTWGHPNRGINVIGRGQSLHPIQMEDGTPATALIGQIMTGHAMGRDACLMHKAATRAGMTGLGASIEGHATLRDPKDRMQILKCTVWSVAIDPSPRNRHALLDPYMQAITAMAKAMSEGSNFLPDSDPARMVFEAFQKAFSKTTDPIREDLLKGISNRDIRALRFLRENPGLSFRQAKSALDRLKGMLP